MIKGEKMPKEKFDKDKTSYHNLHDRIDALEMLSQSILSEIKEIKLMIEEREITITTPIGSITSDSGNHFVDVATIFTIIIIILIFKMKGK